MISDSIGRVGKFILSLMVGGLSRLKVNPNILTFAGMVISFWAAWNFGYGEFRRGALIVILAGLFDMLDGEVARYTRSVTRFGAFYDSVIDRYSDILLITLTPVEGSAKLGSWDGQNIPRTCACFGTIGARPLWRPFKLSWGSRPRKSP